MNSDTGNTTSLVLGFPIRTSSDQRSVDSSPRLIAASYVLHRPLMPRHPPCALKHLQHKNQSFSTKKRKITPQRPTPPAAPQRTTPSPLEKDRITRDTSTAANRCSQPLSTNQTPHPTTKTWGNNTPPTTRSGQGTTGLLSQSPTVCSVTPHHLTATTPHPHEGGRRHDGRDAGFLSSSFQITSAPEPHPLQVTAHPTNRPGHRTPTRRGRARDSWCSLERR